MEQGQGASGWRLAGKSSGDFCVTFSLVPTRKGVKPVKAVPLRHLFRLWVAPRRKKSELTDFENFRDVSFGISFLLSRSTLWPQGLCSFLIGLLLDFLRQQGRKHFYFAFVLR